MTPSKKKATRASWRHYNFTTAGPVDDYLYSMLPQREGVLAEMMGEARSDQSRSSGRERSERTFALLPSEREQRRLERRTEDDSRGDVHTYGAPDAPGSSEKPRREEAETQRQ